MKRYACIVKTKNKHLKFHTTDLLNFTTFLERHYTGEWLYFNVFDKETREQLGSYTTNNKPNTKQIR